MPSPHQYYDPIVQEPGAEPYGVEMPPIHGFQTDRPGVYLLAEDIGTWLRRYAQVWHDDFTRRAIMEAADLIAPPEPPVVAEPELAVPVQPEDTVVYEPLAPVIEKAVEGTAVARVEVFPNEAGDYWYARGVNARGEVIDGGIGQINHDGLLGDATRRWPGAPIYEIPDSLHDSIWAESHHAATWNGRQRPSTRRLFGQ